MPLIFGFFDADPAESNPPDTHCIRCLMPLGPDAVVRESGTYCGPCNAPIARRLAWEDAYYAEERAEGMR